MQGSHDGIDEGQRPHQWHRDGRHFPSGGGAHDGTTMRLEVRPCLHAYALSTRAGTDCAARVVRSLMELDPRKTLVSIDEIGAFNHIKRKAMMEALHTNPELASFLPFVRLFYGKDSKYVWLTTMVCRTRSAREKGAS